MNRLLLLRKLGITHLNSILKPFSKHPISPSLYLSSFSAFSHSSSHSTSSNVPSNPDSDDLPADVTTQELKNRIDRYLKGDMEVLPFIFEGILARKLSGKHEDTDDELMEEFRSKTQQDEDCRVYSDEDLTESDSEEDLTDSDEEPSH